MLCGLPLDAQSPTERAACLSGVRALRTGQLLDLDTGGVFERSLSLPGLVAEMEALDHTTKLLVDGTLDESFADALPWLADAPWHRVTTEQGRTAWVQSMWHRGMQIRFVTKLDDGPLLRAPRDGFCLGSERSIAVWFDVDRAYARYRIERRSDDGDEYARIATIDTPPFVDGDVHAQVRYSYRITGIAADGRVGLSLVTGGTTASRGVRHLRLVLDAGSQPKIDLLRGEVVADGFDLQLSSTHRRSDGEIRQAMFQDRRGLYLEHPSRQDERGPWFPLNVPPRPDPGRERNVAGVWHLLALRGGGTARFRWFPHGEKQELQLECEASLDAEALPVVPRLELTRAMDEVQLRLERVGPYSFDRVVVRDAVTQSVLREIPVIAGFARDPQVAERQILIYEAIGMDRHGRSSPRAEAELVTGPPVPESGRFTLHCQQGWSFTLACHVPRRLADVWYESAAGGNSSIELEADAGLCNLERAARGEHQELDHESGSVAAALVRGITMLVESEIPWSQNISLDDDSPKSEVVVLRTRRGGFVKLARIAQENDRGWTENRTQFEFVHNPLEPKFAQGDPATEIQVKGLRWDRNARNPGVLPPLAEPVAKPPEPERNRPKPPADPTQTLLFDRAKYGDYHKATFSFRHGIRDDPGLKLTRNHWDLQLELDGFRVRMVGGDLSLIRDLGPCTWESLKPELLAGGAPLEQVAVHAGHIYLLHVLHRDANHRVLLRVAEHAGGDSCRLEWILLRDSEWKRSPGLFVPIPLESMLKIALGPGIGLLAAPSGEAATKTYELLRTRAPGDAIRITSVAALGTALQRELDLRLLVDARLTAEPPVLSVLGEPASFLVLLEDATRRAGIGWQIGTGGELQLLPGRR